MGLFNFLRRNNPSKDTFLQGQSDNKDVSNIPRDIFIEDKEPQDVSSILANGSSNGIEVVYAFLQADYESRGYSDALTNPDESNKQDGIKLIKLDLHVLIDRIHNYYKRRLNDLEFHTASRGRAGLIDLVEELKSEKEKSTTEIQRLKEIENSIEPGNGLVERVVLSYSKGFMRGMSAITLSRILK